MAQEKVVRVRSARLPGLLIATVVVGSGWVSGAAHAGRNDLHLLNLCMPAPRPTDGVIECSWLQRDAGGSITGVVPDSGAEERFRSLMSELGVVLAPHVVTPASTIGFAGFQLSAEVATTSISSKQNYWNGVEGVSVDNPNLDRPPGHMTTVGVFVRKGIWLPVPSMEVGAGFQHLLESQMVAYQGYLKLAVHEGFQDWPLPSVAGRIGFSHVTGMADARLDVINLDLLISKVFGIAGTVSLEPFIGGGYLIIKAKSGVFDVTPGCDGYESLAMSMRAGPQCTGKQAGTTNDLELGKYAMPDQESITRRQAFGGFKLHFAAVSLALQYGRTFAQGSRDSRPNGLGAKDLGQAQDRFSVSAGFDF